jgi:hypothetical protein
MRITLAGTRARKEGATGINNLLANPILDYHHQQSLDPIKKTRLRTNNNYCIKLFTCITLCCTIDALLFSCTDLSIIYCFTNCCDLSICIMLCILTIAITIIHRALSYFLFLSFSTLPKFHILYYIYYLTLYFNHNVIEFGFYFCTDCLYTNKHYVYKLSRAR